MIYRHLIQNRLVKTLPNSVVEWFGEPIFSSIASILPFEQNFSINYAGLHFKAPWGFASGWADSFEKMQIISSLGAGAVVSKTITFKPKKGNPFPRFVRWKDHMINSMGLPNHGLAWWIAELRKHRSIPDHFLFSIKGNDAHEWQILTKGIGQYTKAIELNFSCPNVEDGIIDLSKTLEILKDIRKASNKERLFLKISPEYKTRAIVELVTEAREKDLVDGITCFNTFPVHYDYLGNPLKVGGLSGVPLQHKLINTLVELRKIYSNANDLPIFGLAGIWTLRDALKIYKKYDTFPFVLTAMLIQGPFLFRNWYKELDNLKHF